MNEMPKNLTAVRDRGLGLIGGFLNAPNMRLRLAGGIGLVALIAIGVWLYGRYSHVYVQDSRLSSTMVSVSSRAAGWITDFPAKEGATLQKGDLIVEIDARESQLMLAETEASLQGVRAEKAALTANRDQVDQRTKSQYDMAQSMVNEAQARLNGAQSDLQLAQSDFKRIEEQLRGAGADARTAPADRRRIAGGRRRPHGRA